MFRTSRRSRKPQLIRLWLENMGEKFAKRKPKKNHSSVMRWRGGRVHEELAAGAGAKSKPAVLAESISMMLELHATTIILSPNLSKKLSIQLAPLMIIIIAITVCLWWAVVPQLFCKPSKSAGLEIVDLPALSSYFTNPPVVLPPAACLPACWPAAATTPGQWKHCSPF